MAAKKKTKTVELNSRKKGEVRIGDVVELKNTHTCMCAEFPAGTKVLVTGVGERGYDINNNPENPGEGFTMIECGFEL